MRRYIAIWLICCCSPAFADDVAERAVLAQRLATLQEIRALYAIGNAECVPGKGELSTALVELHGKEPAEFGGISPQSAYWPEVEAAYREYMVDACAIFTPEKAEAIYVAGYAQSMSSNDLRAAIAFYTSPAGQAMQAASRAQFQQLAEIARRGASQTQDAATLTYRQSILILRNKYKANPK